MWLRRVFYFRVLEVWTGCPCLRLSRNAYLGMCAARKYHLCVRLSGVYEGLVINSGLFVCPKGIGLRG